MLLLDFLAHHVKSTQMLLNIPLKYTFKIYVFVNWKLYLYVHTTAIMLLLSVLLAYGVCPLGFMRLFCGRKCVFRRRNSFIYPSGHRPIDVERNRKHVRNMNVSWMVSTNISYVVRFIGLLYKAYSFFVPVCFTTAADAQYFPFDPSLSPTLTPDI